MDQDYKIFIKNYFEKKRYYLMVIFAVFLLLLGRFLFGTSLNDIAIPGGKISFPHFSDLDIQNIHLTNDSTDYSLKQGIVYGNNSVINDKAIADKVLRLALYFQWMKEDPVLFSENLNIKEFSESISRVSMNNRAYIKKANWKYDIIPVKFLEKYGLISADYAAFKKDISEENAQKLLGGIKDANGEYYRAAENLENAFNEILKDEPELADKFIYNYYSNKSNNVKLVLGNLKKIKENSEILQGEIAKREKCLLEGARYCLRPAVTFEKPDDLEWETEDIPDLFQKDAIGLGDANKDLLLYELESDCWGTGGKVYGYMDKRCKKDLSYCFNQFTLASNAYFKALREQELKPVQSYLRGMNIPIRYYSATEPYACADSTYKPVISTMEFFYTRYFFSKTPIGGGSVFKKIKDDSGKFSQYPQQYRNIIIEGEKLEASFAGRKYISERMFENLADYYGFAYRYLVESDLPEEEAKRDFLRRYILMKEKTSDLSYVINEYNFFLAKNIEDLSSIKYLTNFNKLYAYLTRSQYSLAFMNFNKFNWRSGQKINYMQLNDLGLVENEKDFKLYMDFDSAASIYGRDRVLQWMKIAKEYEISIANIKISE